MNKLFTQIAIEEDDNLNKNNFFNKCHEVYPKATKLFCDFIDAYKQDVAWNNLFNEYLNIKFHDIPFEMQIGIIMKFFFLKSQHTNDFIFHNKQTLIYSICSNFQILENIL